MAQDGNFVAWRRTETSSHDAGRKLRRPREGGDPVAFENKTLGSRFRGNDEPCKLHGTPPWFPPARERPTYANCTELRHGARFRGNHGTLQIIAQSRDAQ